MAGTRQSVQCIVAEGLSASSVRQTRPIPHAVVDIVGFVDLGTRRRELMEDIRDLRRGIIPEPRCTIVVGYGAGEVMS